MHEESNITDIQYRTCVDGRIIVFPPMPTFGSAEKLKGFICDKLKDCNTFCDAILSISAMGSAIYYSMSMGGFVILPFKDSPLLAKMEEFKATKIA
jgi:hypothetical protein